VAHVELSLSGAFVPQARTPVEAEFLSSVERWTSTVMAATEPCLIISTEGAIAAVSPACSELLGLGKPAEAIGQSLTAVISLIDFTAGGGALEDPRPTRSRRCWPSAAASWPVASSGSCPGRTGRR
jgi:hypothetical protein